MDFFGSGGMRGRGRGWTVWAMVMVFRREGKELRASVKIRV